MKCVFFLEILFLPDYTHTMTPNPRVYPIKSVIKIVDGDTFDAEIDLGFDVTVKKRIRIEGIDCPEARGGSEDDKHFAKIASEWLSTRLNSAVDLQISPSTTRDDPFGREIARVSDKTSPDVGIEMIQAHHAVAYNGEVNRDELKALHEMNYEILRST